MSAEHGRSADWDLMTDAVIILCDTINGLIARLPPEEAAEYTARHRATLDGLMERTKARLIELDAERAALEHPEKPDLWSDFLQPEETAEGRKADDETEGDHQGT